jgi:hypothetical protein
VVLAAQVNAIEELTAANARLVERVAALERIVGRNSGNSSMPPSADDLPGRSAPPPRQVTPAGRRRGKQKGADGSALAWVAEPDETVPHFPQGTCGCGADLAGAADDGVERSHQVHDTPLVTVRVIQHDLHRVRCACGRVHTAGRPAGLPAVPASYGPNLQALVVYLLAYQHLPVARCAQLVAEVTGARCSEGFCHGMLTRAAAAVAVVVRRIKTLITASGVVGFDETTLRVGPAGVKRYVLSASTECYTLFSLGRRDLASFHDFGVLPAFGGVAVHDRYHLYDHKDFHPTGHQLCTAHILRDVQDAAETYPDQHWPAQAARALRALISAWHEARHTAAPCIPQQVVDPLIGELRQAVAVGLSQIRRTPGTKTKQPPGRLLLECLRDRETDLLRFATDTRIWPTNNLSERDLRPIKTQQKISGRLTSEEVTRDRLTIRSYISTAAKHGVHIMTALRDAIAGTPWTPPIPAPT